MITRRGFFLSAASGCVASGAALAGPDAAVAGRLRAVLDRSFPGAAATLLEGAPTFDEGLRAQGRAALDALLTSSPATETLLARITADARAGRFAKLDGWHVTQSEATLVAALALAEGRVR